ncbi:C-C motif chemokine 20b [Denticeps clupeoides]|uniref:C-C motif chemokine 20b n=1 Tax=Denticeps clupeoides TaxID=299321 RepID=UPI0010A47B92|nr:monocyte chemotactic protein 1B-like [Denticeps clupeoides]
MKVQAIALISIFLVLNTFIFHTDSASCCVRYTRKPIRCEKLKSYTMQHIISACDLEAIIFHTVGGHYICANPYKTWTQDRVRCLEKRF